MKLGSTQWVALLSLIGMVLIAGVMTLGIFPKKITFSEQSGSGHYPCKENDGIAICWKNEGSGVVEHIRETSRCYGKLHRDYKLSRAVIKAYCDSDEHADTKIVGCLASQLCNSAVFPKIENGKEINRYYPPDCYGISCSEIPKNLTAKTNTREVIIMQFVKGAWVDNKEIFTKDKFGPCSSSDSITVRACSFSFALPIIKDGEVDCEDIPNSPGSVCAAANSRAKSNGWVDGEAFCTNECTSKNDCKYGHMYCNKPDGRGTGFCDYEA